MRKYEKSTTVPKYVWLGSHTKRGCDKACKLEVVTWRPGNCDSSQPGGVPTHGREKGHQGRRSTGSEPQENLLLELSQLSMVGTEWGATPGDFKHAPLCGFLKASAPGDKWLIPSASSPVPTLGQCPSQARGSLHEESRESSLLSGSFYSIRKKQSPGCPLFLKCSFLQISIRPTPLQRSSFIQMTPSP